MNMRIINVLAIVSVLTAQGLGIQASAPPKVLLQGYVVDGTTGAGLGHVLIAVRSGEGVIKTTTLRSDADGYFSVEVDDVGVGMSFSSRGYARAGYALALIPLTPIQIALHADVPVNGIIVDNNGSPVRARVHMVPIQPGGLQQVLQAFTRIDGSYSIEGTDASRTYRMEAEIPGCPRQALRMALGASLSAGGDWRDTVIRCR